MNKNYYFITLLLVGLTACQKQEPCDATCQEKLPTEFNDNKGWNLVQCISSDSDFEVRKYIGYMGMDFRGNNNHLRCFYWQGWNSQQGFNYTDTRLDEYGGDKALVNRTELNITRDVLNNHADHIEEKFYLRNGKVTLAALTGGGGWGEKWQVHENEALVAEVAFPQYGEYVGSPVMTDDNAINVCGHFQASNTYYFTYKRYNNSIWQYYGEGGYQCTDAELIGAEVINDTAYAALLGGLYSDSLCLNLFKFDGTNWTRIMQNTVPQIGFIALKYLPNGNKPIVIIVSDNGCNGYRMDIDTQTITELFAVSGEGFSHFALLNGEVYLSHYINQMISVSKVVGNSLVSVGSPEIFNIGVNVADLLAINGKIYLVGHRGAITREQIYIVTPQ